MKKSIRKNLITIIILFICITASTYSLFTNIGIKGIKNAFRGLQAGWIFMAAAAVLTSWIFDGLSLHILSKENNKDWSFRDSFQIGMIGLFYSSVTPSASGGQPMQIYYLKKKGMGVSEATAVILKRSIVWQFVLVSYAAILMVSHFNYFTTDVPNLMFLTIMGILAGLIFVMLLLTVCLNQKITSKLMSKIFFILSKLKFKNAKLKQQKIEEKLSLFHSAIKESKQGTKKTYVYLGLCSILGVLMSAAVPYFLYRSFGFCEHKFITMLAADAFVMMLTYFIPLPGAAFGAEAAFVLFFDSFFANHTIVIAVVLWRLFTYYSKLLFGGIISAIKPGINYGKLIKNKKRVG